MLADPTEFSEIDELEDTEYLWYCDACGKVFDGKFAVIPHKGLCDPCLINKMMAGYAPEEDIPF